LPAREALSGSDICHILVTYGFVEVRRRGSHIMMQKSEAGMTRTVPVPDHREIGRGTLMAIIGESRIPRAEVEDDRDYGFARAGVGPG
jgi:predicted RNA binding protein YcfA (HicA-like mRNA interferase family)